MKYEIVFCTSIGQEINDIGSNFPLLSNFYTNSEIITGDYLDIPNSMDIFKDRIYIADKYNKRVIVFPLNGVSSNVFYLGQTGEGYSFDIPFQVVLNKYGEIYVLASQSNIEYKNETNELIDPDFTDTNDIKPYGNFYIYKFSPEGKFIYSIGNNGIHSEAMIYPERIDIDLFDNLYAYYKVYEKDNTVWMVKRFSPSGELSFEFSTKYISSTNIRDGKPYVGRVADIYNLKNDERLVINTDYYKVATNSGRPEDTYHSLDVYSILQNAITKNIFEQKRYMDQFLKVTRDDILVLYSYDYKNHGVRFRFIDINSPTKNEEVYYAPVLSQNCANFGFFVDDDGRIYSLLVKDNTNFVILRWIKVQSRKVS
jgi:hypothetical protein